VSQTPPLSPKFRLLPLGSKNIRTRDPKPNGGYVQDRGKYLLISRGLPGYLAVWTRDSIYSSTDNG